MNIRQIAGFAVITTKPDESRALYEGALHLPFTNKHDYLYVDKMPGCHHFGIWSLDQAAQACFGSEAWPESIPQPTSTIEYELDSPEDVLQAVEELKAQGYIFIHDAKQESWGQTLARFMSPENILIGLSYAPWLHK